MHSNGPQEQVAPFVQPILCLRENGNIVDARIKQAYCTFFIIFPDMQVQILVLTLAPIHVQLNLMLLSVL